MINSRRAVLGTILSVLGGDVTSLQAAQAASTIGSSPLIYPWTILFALGFVGTTLIAIIRLVWRWSRITRRTLGFGYLLGLAGLIVIGIGAVTSFNRSAWFSLGLSASIPGGPPVVFGSGILSGALIMEGVWLLTSSRVPTSSNNH